MSTLTQVSTSGNSSVIVLPPSKRWPYVSSSGRGADSQGVKDTDLKYLATNFGMSSENLLRISSPVLHPAFRDLPVELPVDLPDALKPEIKPSGSTLQNELGSDANGGDNSWQTMWRKNDLPSELSEIQLHTPKVVRDIVVESFNQAKAVRESVLESAESQSHIHGALEVPPIPVLGLRRSMRATHRRQGPKDIPQVHAGPSFSTEPIDSSDNGSSSSSRESIESITTIDSSAESPIAKTMNQLEKPVLPIGLLAPLSYFSASRESEKTSRRHGFMRLLRGKEEKGKEVKREIVETETPKLAVADAIIAKECASCFDDVAGNDAISLACQHSYCRPCFSNLVITAMQHENFWPPKCCLQEIPHDVLERKLSNLELASYRLKAKEYSVPAGDRWYCAKSDCGKWFMKNNPRAQDATVSCTHCNFEMCLFCRGASHPMGERCTQDRGLEATLAAAELEGWRRCYSCHTMVELQSGCRHITCKCRAEFCYTCGARWRTCSCTEADQQRRRTHLAARRAVAAQEEAEIRSAIEAVAQAERQERERAEAEEARLREIAEREERERGEKEEARLAEEMKRLEKMETERRERINIYFGGLRTAMDELHKVQERAIHQRQKRGRVTTQEDLEMIVSEVAALDGQKGKIKWENDEMLKTTKEKHAKQVIETAKRHRADQDRYFHAFDKTGDVGNVDIVTQAQKLEELAQEQDSERTTIRLSQARELCRVIARIKEQKAEECCAKRAGLEKRKQAAIQAVNKLERLEFSDRKWFDQLRNERMAMLVEEESRLAQSGADVPASPMKPSVEGRTSVYRPRRCAEHALAERRMRFAVTEHWEQVY